MGAWFLVLSGELIRALGSSIYILEKAENDCSIGATDIQLGTLEIR
jgi:hypothetical protein